VTEANIQKISAISWDMKDLELCPSFRLLKHQQQTVRKKNPNFLVNSALYCTQKGQAEHGFPAKQ